MEGDHWCRASLKYDAWKPEILLGSELNDGRKALGAKSGCLFVFSALSVLLGKAKPTSHSRSVVWMERDAGALENDSQQ